LLILSLIFHLLLLLLLLLVVIIWQLLLLGVVDFIGDSIQKSKDIVIKTVLLGNLPVLILAGTDAQLLLIHFDYLVILILSHYLLHLLHTLPHRLLPSLLY
jgi:hypothetical protein